MKTEFNMLDADEQVKWIRKAVVRIITTTAKKDENYIAQLLKVFGTDTVQRLAEDMYYTPKKRKGADVMSIFNRVKEEEAMEEEEATEA